MIETGLALTQLNFCYVFWVGASVSSKITRNFDGLLVIVLNYSRFAD